MPNYPGSAPSFTAKSPGQTIASAEINAIADEVVAIGTGLLTGLSHGLTTNGQIVFPASQNASANANTLDDYEEGTWTPVIGGMGGTSGQTYSSQSGRYVKIGKLVWASFDVTLSSKGTITSFAQIQGLPFTVGSATVIPASTVYWESLSSTMIHVIAIAVPSSTAATLYGNTVATVTMGGSGLVAADISNTTRLGGSIIYEASA